MWEHDYECRHALCRGRKDRRLSGRRSLECFLYVWKNGRGQRHIRFDCDNRLSDCGRGGFRSDRYWRTPFGFFDGFDRFNLNEDFVFREGLLGKLSRRNEAGRGCLGCFIGQFILDDFRKRDILFCFNGLCDDGFSFDSRCDLCCCRSVFRFFRNRLLRARVKRNFCHEIFLFRRCRSESRVERQ